MAKNMRNGNTTARDRFGVGAETVVPDTIDVGLLAVVDDDFRVRCDRFLFKSVVTLGLKG